MATIELNAKELELFQEIKNDPNLLEYALNSIRKLKKKKLTPPCQYSVEELRERLEKARKEVEDGDGVAIFSTQEEMESKYSL